MDNILILRASYYQETEEMVERLTEDLGFSRIAVFYQNDSFGQAGLAGAIQALQRRGFEPVGPDTTSATPARRRLRCSTSWMRIRKR